MIPLRDSTRSRSFPVVTVLLIILNIYIYFQQFISSNQEKQQIKLHYPHIPAYLVELLPA